MIPPPPAPAFSAYTYPFYLVRHHHNGRISSLSLTILLYLYPCNLPVSPVGRFAKLAKPTIVFEEEDGPMGPSPGRIRYVFWNPQYETL